MTQTKIKVSRDRRWLGKKRVKGNFSSPIPCGLSKRFGWMRDERRGVRWRGRREGKKTRGTEGWESNWKRQTRWAGGRRAEGRDTARSGVDEKDAEMKRMDGREGGRDMNERMGREERWEGMRGDGGMRARERHKKRDERSWWKMIKRMKKRKNRDEGMLMVMMRMITVIREREWKKREKGTECIIASGAVGPLC